MSGIIHGINNIFNLYFWLIIFRILLSWIPSVNWSKQPWLTLKDICDIYLDLFKKLIPPFSGIDFSPIVALLVLQLAQYLITFILAMFI